VAMRPHAGAHVYGFEFLSSTTLGTYAIALTTDATVSFNTFLAGNGGVQIMGGAGVVSNNSFSNSTIGVDGCGAGGTATIHDNDFQYTLPTSVNIDAGNCVVANNTIGGNGSAGIEVTGGAPRIDGNLFAHSAGYTRGAIIAGLASAPIIRNNIVHVASFDAI